MFTKTEIQLIIEALEVLATKTVVKRQRIKTLIKKIEATQEVQGLLKEDDLLKHVSPYDHGETY